MLKKSKKRFISLLMVAAMIMTMIPFSAFANETTASDLDGHWADKVITEWMDYGVIKGYEDGTIRPNNSITRAELTAMLDRVMDYQTKADNTFTDLQDTWYTDVILKANAAGIIGGYPDGTVKPDATITRQEAVAMFSRVLSLDTENAPEANFTDNADVADWAKDAVNAMAAADYIHGSDGQFRPNDGITRAEVITIFNNIFADLYQASGEYTGDVNGSAVVSTDGVTLKDMTITGDLIIAEGVGDGHVVLDNVTVDGQLIVRGGGENSVIIKGDSTIDTISVERIDGAVRIAVEGNANVETVLIDNGVEDVKIEGRVDTVNVAAANVNVELTGTANDINVAEEAHDATITLTKTATADNVTTNAENTTLIVAGTVSSIDVADTASNSVIKTQSSATIDKVTTGASNTIIEGNGTVSNVVVEESASDATVTTEGTKVENNSNSDVNIGDGEVIAPGDTDTTPGDTTEDPDTPNPPHSHSYTDGICSCGAYDPAWAQVNSTDTWNAAVAAGKNIVVTADFTTDAQLQITKAITVNGNGHTITAGTWTGTTNDNKHLLSVIGDEANNVAIKNLTLDSKNAAYGAQAYCVEGTTLTNVTLKNSNGAGLTVNGSNVKATGLVTSNNGWGGVNVDKGSGVETATSFTFDAASTFAEASPVYSDDATQVTVTAPEGWAKTSTPGENGKNPNKCTWYNLFAGGKGTSDNPYLISTAEQFNAINKLANNMKAGTEYYFEQIADFIYEEQIADFCGYYNGNGHSITSNDEAGIHYLFGQLYGTTVSVKNIILQEKANSPIVVICSPGSQDLTISDITINSADNSAVYVNTNNFGFIIVDALYDWTGPDRAQSYTLENIINNVSIENYGTCVSPFIGSGPCFSNEGSKITYKNCINNGNITGTSQVGFFYGNSAYLAGNNQPDPNNGKFAMTPEQFKAENCKNTGTLCATAVNGIVGTCNGASSTIQELYPTATIGGTFNNENPIKDATFTSTFDSANGTILLNATNSSATNYTYMVVANLSALYWEDGNVSNGIKIILPTTFISEGSSSESETSITKDNFNVYDKKTAIEKNIITDNETFNEPIGPMVGYDYLLKMTDGNKIILVLDTPGRRINTVNGVEINGETKTSSVEFYTYAFANDQLRELKGIKKIG